MGMMMIMGIKLERKMMMGEWLYQLDPVIYKLRLASDMRKIKIASIRLLCLERLDKKSITEIINPCNAPSMINDSKKPEKTFIK